MTEDALDMPMQVAMVHRRCGLVDKTIAASVALSKLATDGHDHQHDDRRNHCPYEPPTAHEPILRVVMHAILER